MDIEYFSDLEKAIIRSAIGLDGGSGTEIICMQNIIIDAHILPPGIYIEVNERGILPFVDTAMYNTSDGSVKVIRSTRKVLVTTINIINHLIKHDFILPYGGRFETLQVGDRRLAGTCVFDLGVEYIEEHLPALCKLEFIVLPKLRAFVENNFSSDERKSTNDSLRIQRITLIWVAIGIVVSSILQFTAVFIEGCK